MPRIRTTKPEFWQDEKLAPMKPLERLVFLGLISMADDAGRLLDNVKSIDGFIFPETDDTSRDSLDVLASAGRLLRYRAASGQRLIQIVNWSKHQKVDKPAKYVLPAPESVTSVPAPVTPKAAKRSRESREKVAPPSRSDLRPTTGDQRSPTTDLPAPDVAGELEAVFDFAPFAEAWFVRFDGPIAPEPNAAALKWLVKRHGAEEVLRRWVIYLASTEAQYASAAKLKSGWGQWSTPPVTVSRGSAAGVAPEILGQAATLFARYQANNLLTRWQRPEYERIGASLVEGGLYPDVASFLDELRVTKPWDLGDSRTDGHAINELAKRLQGRKAA